MNTTAGGVGVRTVKYKHLTLQQDPECVDEHTNFQNKSKSHQIHLERPAHVKSPFSI